MNVNIEKIFVRNESKDIILYIPINERKTFYLVYTY